MLPAFVVLKMLGVHSGHNSIENPPDKYPILGLSFEPDLHVNLIAVMSFGST
jgi:hypothetical protein